MSDAPDWKPETLSTVEWADLGVGAQLQICANNQALGLATCMKCGHSVKYGGNWASECKGSHRRAEEPQS